MPLVIEELTIQVEVNQSGQQGAAQSGQAASASGGGGQTEVIRQCVEEVMEVLRHKNER